MSWAFRAPRLPRTRWRRFSAASDDGELHEELAELERDVREELPEARLRRHDLERGVGAAAEEHVSPAEVKARRDDDDAAPAVSAGDPRERLGFAARAEGRRVEAEDAPRAAHR